MSESHRIDKLEKKLDAVIEILSTDDAKNLKFRLKAKGFF